MSWGSQALTVALALVHIAAAKKGRRPKLTKAEREATLVDIVRAGTATTSPAAAVATPSDTPPPPAAASIRHLFSAPLYQSSVAAEVDVAGLSALALKGYHKVGSSKRLWNRILKSRCSPEGDPVDCEAQLGRDYQQNDRFYHWQVNQGGQGQGDLPEWKEYRTDPVVPQLKSYLQQVAVPQYLHSLGISMARVKGPLSLKLWAAVLEEGATHSMHEHTTSGRCLCSGVIYAQVPPGSGAISFADTR